MPDDVRRAVVLQYEWYARAQQALSDARTGAAGEAAPEQLERLLERASEVERNVVLDARRTGEVSSATADEVLRDIEARAVRDLGQAD